MNVSKSGQIWNTIPVLCAAKNITILNFFIINILKNMSKNVETKGGSFQFNNHEYVAIVAGLFAILGGLLQLIYTYNKKQADDISYTFLLGAIISTLLWVIYHYHQRGGGSFIITLVVLLSLLALLIMKICFDNGRKNKNRSN